MLLAKCGYGIALLPGYLIPDDETVVAIPVVDTMNIEYGFSYRTKEEHVRFFIHAYQDSFLEFSEKRKGKNNDSDSSCRR